MTPTERELLLGLAASYREHLRDWINGKNPNRRGMIIDTDNIEALLAKLSASEAKTEPLDKIPSVKPVLPTTR